MENKYMRSAHDFITLYENKIRSETRNFLLEQFPNLSFEQFDRLYCDKFLYYSNFTKYNWIIKKGFIIFEELQCKYPLDDSYNPNIYRNKELSIVITKNKILFLSTILESIDVIMSPEAISDRSDPNYTIHRIHFKLNNKGIEILKKYFDMEFRSNILENYYVLNVEDYRTYYNYIDDSTIYIQTTENKMLKELKND